MLIELSFGDPVEKEINGKLLRVEYKDKQTIINYGDESLILEKESVIEGLAAAVEWAIGLCSEGK